VAFRGVESGYRRAESVLLLMVALAIFCRSLLRLKRSEQPGTHLAYAAKNSATGFVRLAVPIAARNPPTLARTRCVRELCS
jgi:hypothetical protein